MTHNKHIVITIDNDAAMQRLDRFCRKYFKAYGHITLKDIYHWIRKWLIKVNGKRASESDYVREGDQIILHPIVTEQLVDKATQKDNGVGVESLMRRQWWTWDSLILYEDDNWIIRNKPAGMVAHEGNKHTEDITMNQLLECKMKNEKWKIDHARRDVLLARPNETNETFKASFGFRLDKDTTGVLVAAKTYPALQHINQIIRDHDISKEYLTWICGKPDFNSLSKNYNYTLTENQELTIDEPLFKGFNATTGRAQTFVNPEKGLSSQTIIQIQKTIEDPFLWPITLLKCRLLSGRMHQIRAHLAYIGFSVLGDLTYGNQKLSRLLHKHYKINRQLLHSYHYSFADLDGKKIDAIAPIPRDFEVFEISSNN